MTIQVGDNMPEGVLMQMTADGPAAVSTAELFSGKKVVLFALPGAFTPTCSAKHVPSYIANAEKLTAKGVNAVACLSVNDAFVMGAWAKDQNSGDKVMMLADGSADYAKALGLELDLTARGMGMRAQRFALVADNGVVTYLGIEPNPGEMTVSGAEAILDQL